MYGIEEESGTVYGEAKKEMARGKNGCLRRTTDNRGSIKEEGTRNNNGQIIYSGAAVVVRTPYALT
jgi:hypothetical protein